MTVAVRGTSARIITLIRLLSGLSSRPSFNADTANVFDAFGTVGTRAWVKSPVDSTVAQGRPCG